MYAIITLIEEIYYLGVIMKLINIDKNSKYIEEIEKIYLYSFPANERMDFNDVLDRKAPNSDLFALCNDEQLVGFTFISCLENFAYIIYLAIAENERNKHYGSIALKLINEKYKDKTKVLCVEKPLKQGDLKSKRIYFYKFY